MARTSALSANVNTEAWLFASNTSTRRRYIAVGVRLLTCSSYERNAPESLTATVGGLGTLNSTDGGICVCAPTDAADTATAVEQQRRRTRRVKRRLHRVHPDRRAHR